MVDEPQKPEEKATKSKTVNVTEEESIEDLMGEFNKL
jgi:hypothetical protein